MRRRVSGVAASASVRSAKARLAREQPGPAHRGAACRRATAASRCSRRQVDLADARVVPRGVGRSPPAAGRRAPASAPASRTAAIASRGRDQPAQAGAERDLERAVPERVFEQAVQQDQRRAAPTPAGAAARVSRQGRCRQGPPQPAATDQHGRRHAQFHGQVQRQVVRVVQDVAEARARIQRHEVRVIEFAPAPARASGCCAIRCSTLDHSTTGCCSRPRRPRGPTACAPASRP